MIDHLSIGVRDIARSKRFYDAALKPLGYACLSEGEGSLGYGGDAVALWIGAAERPVPADEKSGLHVCFAASTLLRVGAAKQRCRPDFSSAGTGRSAAPIHSATASRP